MIITFYRELANQSVPYRLRTSSKSLAYVLAFEKTFVVHPHTVRHYAIQSNLRNGLDLYSCSKIAGHENIQVTKRYLQGLEMENILEMAQKTSPLMNLR
ncbi:tyrosine-type recombinase/integrase [Bacillus anthracis]|uniref:tyrosine-type recombinase/integrase n=1 Tax=Bacillus anthracis TaxID=1392 RepID=UPI0035930470